MSTQAQTSPVPEPDAKVDYYGAQYSGFATELYAKIRRETYGEDIGQSGWQTATEQDRFLGWLGLESGSRLLEVACGSGGPSIRLARRSGAEVVGIDVHAQAIANANQRAESEGLGSQVRFERSDATQPLQYSDASFDALVCIDAINHFPNRFAVLKEWARVLKPGGRLLYVDPIVVTGPLTNHEIAVRSSVGFYLFVPLGANEAFIEGARLELQQNENTTASMADIAARFAAARAERADALRQIEGEVTFQGQQEFLRIAELVARERRLSRFAYVARKPITAS
jgi:ubiquinone/menaquinone biosynthesis C-methylase UbiE